jgi:hypothetical protein
MAIANCFANHVSGGVLVEGSEAQFIAKETLQPTAALGPATYETGGKSTTISITAFRGFPKIKKVLAVTGWMYWSNGTKRPYKLKMGSAPAVSKETPGPGWMELTLTKAEAEALTQKGLEEITIIAEQTGSASGKLTEVYLVVEYEPEGAASSNPMVMMI